MSSQPTKDGGSLDALLVEDRRFPPPPDFRARAVLGDPSVYRRAAENREDYWRHSDGRYLAGLPFGTQSHRTEPLFGSAVGTSCRSAVSGMPV